jgi:hypothetical protein
MHLDVLNTNIDSYILTQSNMQVEVQENMAEMPVEVPASKVSSE